MALDQLRELLERWQAGALSLAQLDAALADRFSATAAVGDVLVDLDRQRRCGYPEVIYGAGKSPDSVLGVIAAQQQADQASLITRATAEQAEVVAGAFPQARYNPIARTIAVPIAAAEPPRGSVTVIAAGTTDRAIAEEALETARWMGCTAELLLDVGVAGPQRLLERRQRFVHADAVVVVAGMEGALPSVVAGWVACPVIAVPTSVGYGTQLQGFAPLLSMLNSCAANVAVVNIDAGFKGGYLAGLIARGRAPRTTEDTADGDH